MSPEQTDLARRLVAHPRWRWVAGMLNADGWRSMGEDEMPTWAGSDNGMIGDDTPQDIEPGVPDLTDYATAAILLRMYMECGPCSVASPGMVSFAPDSWVTGIGDSESPDLGTVAATALLEAWRTG